MSDATMALRQVGYEQRAFWRNPASAFFAFAFPLMFLGIFGTQNRGARLESLGGIPYNSYYVPALITFGVIGACMTNISMTMTIRRDSGVLKRVRGTPLPPWVFMAGVIGSSAVVSAILALLLTAAGNVFYSVNLPHHLGGLLITLVVGGMSFCALGLALSALIPNAEAAPAITNAVVLPLLFISGTFYPLDPNSVLTHIANWFPMRPLALAVFHCFDPSNDLRGVPWSDLWKVLLWGAAGLFVAVRRFQWAPRRT
ncbi:MAG TPA: ABC transporter permease [Candidatus Dormibacteraeota bacterium]|jgi:ABC-2 type transport system permease protein|nr:ABC transporter permease [Candidatus Dormibacteraeota bacterium]